MASIFGLTPQDLLRKVAPAPGTAHSFTIGVEGPPENDLSDADAMAIIEAQESMVESYMRPKYKRLLRRVEGEVAVRWAQEGQTTCRASLRPIVSMTIYRNFPRSRAWPDRRPSEAMPADHYSLDAESGEITFAQPLRANDMIYLDYEHEGASKLLDIRELVLSLSAVELARRFAYFRSAEGFDRFEGWQVSSAGHLRDLGRTDGAQIGAFDAIELVNQTNALNLGAL